MADPFIAEIRIFAGNFAPRGWAFCNGQLLPISQNTALFSLVGTTYGGDGRTTFGLPNLQGRVPMHPGNGPGLTARQLGESGGVETVTLAESQMPTHTHGLNAAPDPAEAPSPVDNAMARSVGGTIYQTDTTQDTVTMAAQALPNAGGDQAHKTDNTQKGHGNRRD